MKKHWKVAAFALVAVAFWYLGQSYSTIEPLPEPDQQSEWLKGGVPPPSRPIPMQGVRWHWPWEKR
jgi:hypothetical protein